MRGGVAIAALSLLLIGDAALVVEQGTVEQTAKGNSMIAKVIEMLGQEKDKIAENLASESKVMAEYMEWCDDTQTEHAYAIKTANSKIEDLDALIEDNGAQIKALDDEVADLGSEMAERQEEIDKANANREKEKEEFGRAQDEQTAMIEELEQMEVALKQQMAAMTTPPPVAEEGAEEPAAEAPAAEALIQDKKKTGAFDAFVQLRHRQNKMLPKGVDLSVLERAMAKMINSVWVDPESKRNIATLNKDGVFIQAGEDPAAAEGEATAAPTVEIGADQLNQINANNDQNLAAFEGLKGKAEESLQRQREEEVKKQHEHDLAITSLTQAIALAQDKVDDAKRDRSRLAEEKAKAEEELGEVKESKRADEVALEEVTHECNDAAASWSTRQVEAKAESAAIDKAKEILSSRVTVLLSLQVKDHQPEPPSEDAIVKNQVRIQKLRQTLVGHFRGLGNQLHSLAMLNLVSVATSEPMAQVKNLLTDLIGKLEKEASEAASLHQFCKEEKEKTANAQEKKQMTLDTLGSRIDKASTKKSDLEETVASLSGEIAEMETAQAKATQIRNDAHDLFVKTEADFSGAADAVDDAIDALKEYYGSSLLQVDVKSNAAPQLGGARSDSAGGIVGMLETMGEEFRKTVKEARSDERSEQKAFETMENNNKVSKAAKEAEIKASESEIKSLTVSVHAFGQDHKMATKEMDAINEYVEKLKPQCEGRTVPYAERKAKRESEIQGLKEALSIIEADSPTAPALVQVRRLRHRM